MTSPAPHAETPQGRGRGTHDDVAADDVVAFVGSALARSAAAGVSSSRFVHVAVPAPWVSGDVAMAVAAPESLVVWGPPTGEGIVAWGEAAKFAAAGSDRFASVRRWAEQVFARLDIHAHRDAQAPTPRVFGGFAFAVGSAAEPRWRDFGDGSFVLPRWVYGTAKGGAWLSLTCSEAELQVPSRAGELTEELAVLLQRLRGPQHEVVANGTGVSGLSSVTHLSPNTWHGQITAAQDAIRAGAMEKVVLARRSTVETAAILEPTRMLSHLSQKYPECFAFAFARDRAVFLGATPERLIARRGNQVMTEALAGSISVDAKDAAASLRESGKDREEHDVVVRHLTTRLAPLCAELSYPPAPGVRVLPNVIHLCTPVSGTLSAPVHVVDLLALLHPTPAVGGAPVTTAVDWIASKESAPRGWYAGPVGWFDATGDGEFAVALRSALVTGASAWVYAGAGIVRDSNPEVEYDETTLKLRVALGALGISG